MLHPWVERRCRCLRDRQTSVLRRRDLRFRIDLLHRALLLLPVCLHERQAGVLRGQYLPCRMLRQQGAVLLIVPVLMV